MGEVMRMPSKDREKLRSLGCKAVQITEMPEVFESDGMIYTSSWTGGKREVRAMSLRHATGLTSRLYRLVVKPHIKAMPAE